MTTRKQSSASGGAATNRTLGRKKDDYYLEVQIMTEKGHYLPGDKMKGKIYLVAREALRANKLLAVVEGYNQVSWEEGRNQSIYSEEVKLFEERILVRMFNKPIPIGRFSFDFTYIVPEFLPSSFSLGGCRILQWEDIKMIEASVRYSIKAVIEKDERQVNKETKQQFLIHALPETTSTECRENITHQIKTFGCFPRGYSVTISITLDKPCYSYDDVLGLTIEVTNMTALVCKNVIAVLFRKLKVLAQRSQRNIRTKEYMLEFEDVQSGEKAIFKRDINLSETNILPTTNSRNIKCNYVLAVRCDIPFATNVDVMLPVTMVEEPDHNHEKRFPPEQLYKPWRD